MEAYFATGVNFVGLIILGYWTYKNGKSAAKKDEVDSLRGIIQELKSYISDLEADKEDLQAWAERLVCQVREAGMTPAKFERRTQPRGKG
jgi:hypothetical protein